MAKLAGSFIFVKDIAIYFTLRTLKSPLKKDFKTNEDLPCRYPWRTVERITRASNANNFHLYEDFGYLWSTNDGKTSWTVNRRQGHWRIMKCAVQLGTIRARMNIININRWILRLETSLLYFCLRPWLQQSCADEKMYTEARILMLLRRKKQPQ